MCIARAAVIGNGFRLLFYLLNKINKCRITIYKLKFWDLIKNLPVGQVWSSSILGAMTGSRFVAIAPWTRGDQEKHACLWFQWGGGGGFS